MIVLRYRAVIYTIQLIQPIVPEKTVEKKKKNGVWLSYIQQPEYRSRSSDSRKKKYSVHIIPRAVGQEHKRTHTTGAAAVQWKREAHHDVLQANNPHVTFHHRHTPALPGNLPVYIPPGHTRPMADGPKYQPNTYLSSNLTRSIYVYHTAVCIYGRGYT